MERVSPASRTGVGGLAVLAVGLFAVLVAPFGGPASASPVDRGELGRKLDGYMRRVTGSGLSGEGFSGSVLVAKNDEVLLHGGYGIASEAAGRPVVRDTVFGVASLAKQFTAAAILKLQEQGRLDVRDQISEHLEGVPRDKAGITIHQLLTHTSGLTKNHAENDFVEMDREEALEAIFSQPLARRPGSAYEYSDSGYALAAAIVEEVSGQPFESYVEENLFEPAGMGRTGFWDEARFDRLPVANGYMNGRDRGSPASFPGTSWAIMGVGGLLSTTADLHAWWRALEGNTVLSEESTGKLFDKHVRIGEGEYYGYGWEIREAGSLGNVITHNGAGNTGNAYLAAYPERDLVVVVMSNRVTWRSLTLGGLLEDDDLPYQVGLPADELGGKLAENVESGDFSELPSPTLPLRLTLFTLGVLLAVLLGATLLVRKFRARTFKKRKEA